MHEELDRGRIVIVAGFQGISDAEMDITTLGRGGSDTTAVALAAALRAERCEIYTDVDGVYTADPRVVPEARKLTEISYEEMLELASLGAKVMHSGRWSWARSTTCPSWWPPASRDAPGTLIHGGSQMESSATRCAASPTTWTWPR